MSSISLNLPFSFIPITVVMILRVYAMWNRSRTILCVLLLIYVPSIIIVCVVVGIYGSPGNHLSGMSRA